MKNKKTFLENKGTLLAVLFLVALILGIYLLNGKHQLSVKQQKEISQLRRDLKKSEDNFHKAQSDIEALKHENVRMTNQHSRSLSAQENDQKKFNTLKDRLAELEIKYKDRIADLEQRLQGAPSEEHVQGLRQTIAELTAQSESYAQREEEAQAKFSTLKDQLAELEIKYKDRIADLEQRLQGTPPEQDSQESQFSTRQQDRASEKQALQGQIQQAADQDATIAKLEQQPAQAQDGQNKEIQRLSAQLATVRQQLRERVREVSSLRQEHATVVEDLQGALATQEQDRAGEKQTLQAQVQQAADQDATIAQLEQQLAQAQDGQNKEIQRLSEQLATVRQQLCDSGRGLTRRVRNAGAGLGQRETGPASAGSAGCRPRRDYRAVRAAACPGSGRAEQRDPASLRTACHSAAAIT
ncbi:hypothetical protein CSA57_01450 [candidate division KSB3 bacterium]|nr:MAG: hypothetical protein CSA57_01450 [candidate division KSB3 bacterium]